MRTILLLLASNVFMTIAWYGHLKFHDVPLWKAIVVSWGIAFFEYCLQVPANRGGYLQGGFSAFELKVLQEVITLAVFTVFAVVVLKETPKWNHAAAAVCLCLAVMFAFWRPRSTAAAVPSPVPSTAAP
jgi:uncharacterized protein